MTAALVLGIDIGNAGALAVLADGELIAVHNMPILRDGPAGRPAVNAPLLAEIVARSHATQAFVEFVAARPGESATGAFSFGRSRGVIEGVLGALSLPISFVTPQSWKRFHSIPPGPDKKDLARSKAIALWPTKAELFARKLDHNRAESALIGLYGLARCGGVK
jgi:crossover junction endodeoxyribonuclease RuvC